MFVQSGSLRFCTLRCVSPAFSIQRNVRDPAIVHGHLGARRAISRRAIIAGYFLYVYKYVRLEQRRRSRPVYVFRSCDGSATRFLREALFAMLFPCSVRVSGFRGLSALTPAEKINEETKRSIIITAPRLFVRPCEPRSRSASELCAMESRHRSESSTRGQPLLLFRMCLVAARDEISDSWLALSPLRLLVRV
jgi:hypothetical protein